MRKLALIVAAAAATLVAAAPTLVSEATAAPARVHLAQAVTKTKVVKVTPRRTVVKRVVVKRHRTARPGWSHHGRRTVRTVVVKKRNGTVVKRKIIHRAR